MTATDPLAGSKRFELSLGEGCHAPNFTKANARLHGRACSPLRAGLFAK